MEVDKIDFETATEDELAALRGDNLASAEPEPAPEPEPTPEPEASAEPAPEPEASAEPAPEPEASAEPAAEPEPAPEPKPPTDGFMIPKSRYDAVMARLREAEAKLNQPQAETQQPQTTTQTQQPEQPSYDQQLADLDVQIGEAVKDGDGDKASQLMRQSRELTQRMFQEQVAQAGTQTTEVTREAIRYEAFVQNVESLVPEANPDGDQYDEGFVTEVWDLADAFMRQGKTQTQALAKALDYTKPGWNSPRAEATHAPQTTETAAPAPEPRRTNVKQNVEDAKSQPPRMESGENSDTGGIQGKLDVFKLSDDAFEKLTEDQLAELRGDFA